jgi:hypothetical protein
MRIIFTLLLFVVFNTATSAQEIIAVANKVSQTNTPGSNSPKWKKLNKNNLKDVDDKNAEVDLKKGNVCESIILSDFGIDLPNNSFIGSITVDIIGRAEESGKIELNGLSLIKVTGNNTYTGIAGTNRLQHQGGQWSSAQSVHSFGGGSVASTWGTAIAQEVVEDEAFGIAISLKNASEEQGEIKAFINQVYINIIYSVNAPLPVNFVSFKGYKTSTGNELVWKVAQQVNVKGYDVERSNDGIQFFKIGYVAAADNQDSYTFTDIQPAVGTVYYRIKNVDSDGAYKYSTVVSIKNGAASIVLRAFPIPAQNHVTLQHNEAGSSALISLVGFDGRVVKTIRPSVGSMQTEINLSGLPSGMYMVRYDNGKGQVETLKLVKQ